MVDKAGQLGAFRRQGTTAPAGTLVTTWRASPTIKTHDCFLTADTDNRTVNRGTKAIRIAAPIIKKLTPAEQKRFNTTDERAIDKIKGLTLGSTEKQALADKQAEHDKKIRDQARKEALAELRKRFGNHA